jgi:hypothetical protein
MKRYGLTSEEVAREMSEGALNQEECCADLPARTRVWQTVLPETVHRRVRNASHGLTSCMGGETVTFSETKAFNGERNEVRRAAALYALSRIEHCFNRLPEHRAKPNGGEHE